MANKAKETSTPAETPVATIEPAAPSLETPTDETAAPSTDRKPTAGNRYRLIDDATGDFRIYEISGESHAPLPKGSLMAIPDVPGFTNTADAKKFIRNSGETLKGKQLMILKAIEICSVQVQTVSKVEVKFKQRKAVGGPAAGDGEDGK